MDNTTVGEQDIARGNLWIAIRGVRYNQYGALQSQVVEMIPWRSIGFLSKYKVIVKLI